MNFALRIYRRLAEAFPHEFKMVYGGEVSQLGEDVVEEIAREHGVLGLIRLIADIAIRVPAEYLSEMRRDMRYAVRALDQVARIRAGRHRFARARHGNHHVSLLARCGCRFFADLPAAANAKELAMPQNPVSFPYIEQFREQKSLFRGVAAFEQGVPFNVSFQGNGNAKPQRVFGQLVSPDYFAVLGVRPQRGRVLSDSLDKPGDAPVVVISDRFWRNRMNSSPDALGQALHLNGQTATIVGIAPKNFDGALPFIPAELFVPITVPAALAPELGNDILLQTRCQRVSGAAAPGTWRHDGIRRSRSRSHYASPGPAGFVESNSR